MHGTSKNNGWSQLSKVKKLRFYTLPITENILQIVFIKLFDAEWSKFILKML